jgi:hypothetical protein
MKALLTIMVHDPNQEDPRYSQSIELDLVDICNSNGLIDISLVGSVLISRSGRTGTVIIDSEMLSKMAARSTARTARKTR